MKRSSIPASLFLSVIAIMACSRVASAQEIIINDDTSDASNPTWTLTPQSTPSMFTTNATDGVTSLSTSAPNYQTDVASYIATQGYSVPAGFATTGAGWVFHSNDGTVIVTPANSVSLGDPFVAYSFAFYNSSGSSSSYSMTFNSTFTAETYNAANPGVADASFGVTLTDGAASGPVSTSASQLATLSLSSSVGSSVGGFVDIGPLSLTTGSSTTTSGLNPTAGYVAAPDGTFDTLSVTVSGSYSSGAEVGVSGRVDVIPASEAAPEPSTWALMFTGLATLGFVVRNRRKA